MAYRRSRRRIFRKRLINVRRNMLIKGYSGNRLGRFNTARAAIGDKVHYFKRSAYFESFITSSTNTVGVKTNGARGDICRLSDVPSYTEFTALFDQYKILKVVVKLMPRGNVSEDAQQTGIAQSSFANIWAVVDKDDNTAPASVAQILQYSKVKQRRTNQTLTLVFTPSQLREVYNNGITTGYGVDMKPKWLDCASPDVQHFGYKTLLEGPNCNTTFPSTVTCVYDMKITYYLAFKNVI